jgi:beta-glucuronidase
MKAIKSLLVLFLMLQGFLVSAQEFRRADPKEIALFPQQNDLRNTLNLSGIWKFKKDSLGVGEKEGWYNGLKDARSIAVPGSWNEQFDDLRDYLDLAWYETESFVPSGWKGQHIFIRVGSANYMAKVWINGIPVGQHEGGHLPFAFEITPLVKWNAQNRITIAIENVLKPTRVPTGGATAASLMTSFPKANFDFFPYAGLNRAVWLYSLPAQASIRDITLKTSFQETTGNIEVEIQTTGKALLGFVVVTGNNQRVEQEVTFRQGAAKATISLPQVRLWSPEDPFLYQVEVILGSKSKAIDRYTLEAGVRTVSVDDKHILLNGKPVYLKGFGKHEDFPVFGRGTAYPVMVKDYSLMRWIGANSFRTSHYPYDEEYMNMADREGFLVIDETPAVGLYFHGDTASLNARQAICKQYISELIHRDKNHPSVIMWSIANEPFPPGISQTSGESRKSDDHAIPALTELFSLAKKQDPTRPATLVGVMGGPVEWLAFSDVVCVNRYWGWYTNPGEIKAGAAMLDRELDMIYQKTGKPIILTEFGADTYPGMHAEQPEMFTEEYQTAFIKAYLDVLDKKDYVTGAHVWAFADFKTGQGTVRFGGMNYKGVFTRDRKPKMAAHFLRSRWR